MTEPEPVYRLDLDTTTLSVISLLVEALTIPLEPDELRDVLELARDEGRTDTGRILASALLDAFEHADEVDPDDLESEPALFRAVNRFERDHWATEAAARGTRELTAMLNPPDTGEN